MAKQRTFSDLDFNFTRHPYTNDVTRTYDATAIKAAVKHLVLTNFYGRPFHPEIGSHVNGLLFENQSVILDYALEETIKEVIRNWEPRVEAGSLEVYANFNERTNTYSVDVYFLIKGLLQPITLEFLLERVK